MDLLKTVMTAWSGARSMGEDAFEKLFMDGSTGVAALRVLRAAAEGATTAKTHEDLDQAAADLTEGMQGVGFDNWPRFLWQVADRVEANQQVVAPLQGPAIQAAPVGGQNDDMTLSADGRAELVRREGHVAGQGYYNDNANNCTYGVGLLAHNGPCTAAELSQVVNAQQADAEFQRRVDDAVQRVRNQVQDRRLTQNQFDALVSATFNTGRNDNAQFLGAANHGDDADVARQLGELTHVHDHNAQGNRVGPPRLSRGLVARRAGEVQQYQRP